MSGRYGKMARDAEGEYRTANVGGKQYLLHKTKRGWVLVKTPPAQQLLNNHEDLGSLFGIEIVGTEN